MKKKLFCGGTGVCSTKSNGMVRGVLPWAFIVCLITLIVGCGGAEKITESEADRVARVKRELVCNVMVQFDAYENSLRKSLDRSTERIDNREATFEGVVGMIGDMRQGLKLVRQYTDNLATIDISDCPPDFQAAFIVYLQKLDEVAQMMDKLSGSNGFKGFVSGVWDVSSSSEAMGDDLDVAESELRRIAAQYGYVLEE